ncbi:MAG: type II toxin-antitoxin system RelE/ParE family toxin [Hyphomicrobium sp.]|nr:plasmid maintenance system killer protein [Hyphomicrobium sp.]
MIQSFRCRKTEAFFRGGPCPAQWRAFESVAYRKLAMLEDAVVLRDVGQLPENRLEALRGNRKGQHSIRINDQWRICFCWKEQGPDDVEITDDH